MKKQIDSTVHAFIKEHQIPGLAIGVFDGRNEHYFNYGFANKAHNIKVTENTIFAIASITKVFTTTALALHVLQGDMNLKNSISKYIPELNFPTKDITKVTLLQLATHTSSLPRVGGNWRTGNTQKIYKYLQNWKSAKQIGSDYEYSNLAFGLLGFALEKVERKPYAEIINNHILIPLNMFTTFTIIPNPFLSQFAQGYDKNGKPTTQRAPGYIPGSGAIRSTSKDLMKFLKANMGLYGPKKLIQAMKFAQEPYYKVRDNFFMGLGWQRFNIKKTLIIDKNGGIAGYSSYIGWIPDKNIGIIILNNKGKARTTALGRSLLLKLSAQ